MGPSDAIQYWMHMSLRLQNEHDIANAFMFKFPGPYEKPNVCVSANGLLILYHHMDAMHGLVNEQYRPEVHERLLQVIAGQGGHYIEEHDDGEIDEQVSEEGGQGLTEPPAGSRFWYTPAIKTRDGGVEAPIEAVLDSKTEENRALKAELSTKEAEFEAERRRMQSTSELLEKRIAELEQSAGESSTHAESALPLSTIARRAGMRLPQEHSSKLCKLVAAKFRSEFPHIALRKRHHVVCFPEAHADAVERSLRHELMQLELAQAETKQWVDGVGGALNTPTI
jgi:hypothetical protein